MDAVAAASSIAGILGIVGQSINGIVRLRGFFLDISSASVTINRLLQDINSLLRVLHDAERLFSQLSVSTFCGTPAIDTASLFLELKNCHEDISRWLRVAAQLRPSAQTGTKAWLKRLWVAVNQASVNDIRMEVARHRQAIQINLVVVGRGLNMNAALKIELIGAQIGQLQAVSASLDTAMGHQRKVLERIENHSVTCMHSSAASTESLKKMANSLSELESMASATPSHLNLCRSLLNGLPVSSVFKSPPSHESRSLSAALCSEVQNSCHECYFQTRMDQSFTNMSISNTNKASAESLQSGACERNPDLYQVESSCQLLAQPWSSSTLDDSSTPRLELHQMANRREFSIPLPSDAEHELSNAFGKQARNDQNSPIYENFLDKADQDTESSAEDDDCDYNTPDGLWIHPSQTSPEKFPTPSPPQAVKSPSPPQLPKSLLETQHTALLTLTKTAYPPPLSEYISWKGLACLLQTHRSLALSSSTIDPSSPPHPSSPARQKSELDSHLCIAELMLVQCRQRCLKAGYPLDAIDGAFAPSDPIQALPDLALAPTAQGHGSAPCASAELAHPHEPLVSLPDTAPILDAATWVRLTVHNPL